MVYKAISGTEALKKKRKYAYGFDRKKNHLN